MKAGPVRGRGERLSRTPERAGAAEGATSMVGGRRVGVTWLRLWDGSVGRGRSVAGWAVVLSATMVLAALATGLQLLAEQTLEFRSPFSFYYLAVLISALRWGSVASIAAAIESAILCSLFILPEERILFPLDPVDLSELMLFVIVTAAIIWLVRGLRRAMERSARLSEQASRAAELLREEVAERRRAEEALARQRDTLEETVRERTRAVEVWHERVRLSERMAAVGELAAGLAHDLGNLIMPMQLRLRAVAARPLTEETAEDVRALVRCVDYLTSLARGLRLFSRDPDHAEAGEVTHTAAWLRDTAPFFRNVLPREIELAIDVPDDLPDLAVPPHRLTQAVINLIGNARDAIAPPPPPPPPPSSPPSRQPGQPAGDDRRGLVTLRARRAGPDGDTVRLDVIDDGPGMSDEVRQRCLEPYFTTRGERGTGLGLALVQDIAHSAGGGIEIESSPGHGARVSLTLPVARAEVAETVGEEAL